MAASVTYTPIANYTFASAAANYTFSSIPSTYTDLVLVITGTNTTSAQSLNFTFNGDTGTNYSRTYCYGDGTSAVSGRDSNQTSGPYAYWGTTQGVAIVNLMNYANSTTYKSVLVRSNDPSLATNMTIGLWRSTAAITSIKIAAASTTLAAGTVISLYGIAAA